MSWSIKKRQLALVQLGAMLRQWFPEDPYLAQSAMGAAPSVLEEAIRLSGQFNPWFTDKAIRHALHTWGQVLSEEAIIQWIGNYRLLDPVGSARVVLITAGNIPLVGFHDLLTVFIGGQKALCKLSSQDSYLIPALLTYLNPEEEVDFPIYQPAWPIKDFDAIIATGSNNTNRYFESYFGNYPHVFRRNRTSVALLNGSESLVELKRLTDDLFLYFGLGCRNVSKIFVPRGYDFEPLLTVIREREELTSHHKFGNNYHYQRAVHLMNEAPFIDTGNALLRPDPSFHAPVGCINYEEFDRLSEVEDRIDREAENIQCRVRSEGGTGWLAFGETQSPGLLDYADGRDTMEFVLSLNQLHENA